MTTTYNNTASTTTSSIINHIITTTTNNNNTENNASLACPVIKFGGVIPWNNPQSLVSAETEDLVSRVRFTVVLPVLFLIGGPANVINMAVFHKQGLKERINVCLFSLSLVDLLFLLSHVFYFAEQAYLQIVTGFAIEEKYGPHMRSVVNHNLLGFYGLPLVSQVISALIASERCFCVLWPLRSQTILSSSSTTILILLTSLLIMGLYALVATGFRTICAHDPYLNTNVWAIVPSAFYLKNMKALNFLRGYMFGATIPGVIIVVVIVATMVTVVKLRQAAAWRASISASGSGSSSSSRGSGRSSMSARDAGVTVMLVYNSAFFVVCVLPASLKRLAGLLVPELGIGRQQQNLSILLNWVLDMVNYTNATFNILIYYNKGSRYRKTFWQLMGRGGRSKTAGFRAQSRKDAVGGGGVSFTK